MIIGFKERIYKFEKPYNFESVEKHPLLKQMIVKSSTMKAPSATQPLSMKSSNWDPLSQNSPLDLLRDPLASTDRTDSVHSPVLNMEPWSSKRMSILTTYTTSEKLTIISSFLMKKPDEDSRLISKTSSILDKVKSKLEQLDQFDEEVHETSNLSVQQFTDKINELQSALKTSWRDGQRVKSLQIIIQSTKLLSEANVAQFFPSKFVLITDLVDNFGSLVFERLKAKSAIIQRGSRVPIALPDNFHENQIPEVAKETARNWLYKVASIRELVARLYIETGLLSCYRFFDSKSIPESLIRLMKMARGIGNPLLATYARSYVARIGISMDFGRKEYLKLAFEDTLESLNRLSFISGASLDSEGIVIDSYDKMISYLRLFVPAVDWILQCLCVGLSTTSNDIDRVIKQVEKSQNALLVHSLLNSIPVELIKTKPLFFAEMIQTLPDSGYPRYLMWKQLGACVSLSFTLGQEQAMSLFKLVWKSLTKFNDLRCFIECCDAWAEFLAKNFDIIHINRFLAYLVKEVMRENACQEFSNQLMSILNKILSKQCDFQNLLSSPELVQYLAMFDREPTIIEVRQMVLDSFFNANVSESINDPVLMQTCLRMLKEMYDSLNSLSVSDNKKTVARLIITLINRVTFGSKNVEQELDFLTQCRNTFGSIEKVLSTIVERVNGLAMRVRSLRPNREHNSGSISFVRACMAFSFITIPSLENPVLVIRLYTCTSQVALVNGCLGQAEACIKESISLLSKLDNDSKISDKLVDPATAADLAASIASTLLMCPDLSSVIAKENQNQQILYLLKGLINAINMCPLLKTDHIATQKSVIKGELYIKIILLLTAFSQPHYIYYAGKTDANDKIYGGSAPFLTAISEMFSNVVAKIRSLNCKKVDQLLKEIVINNLHSDYLENLQNSLTKDWLTDIILS